MVPINDIRIGNFLIFDFPNGSKVQHRSEHIHKKFDGYRTVITINDVNIDKVHGIPVSGEWLMKFGFEKIDKQFQHNWVITKPKTGEHYSIQFSEDKYWLSNSEFDAWCYVIRDVEYVHQLQNLYYDLSGEELTFKDSFQTDIVEIKKPQSI